jgi:hypothetical protein
MGDTRARRKLAQQLADAKQDPAAAWSSDREAVISNDLWNLIKKRHQRIMKWVLTWPGPVIMISRERMAVVYENDKPTKFKDWALECRKDLHFQATAWVRMHPNGTKPEVLKLRSGQRGRSIAVGNAKPIDRFNAAHVIFDVIGCESGVSRAPTYQDLNADQVTAGDNPDGDHYRDAALAATGNVDRLKALYTEVGSRGLLQTEVPGADGKPVTLGVLIRDLGIAAAATATTTTPGEPASADPVVAAADVASDESGLVDMAQLQALRAALATLGVREATKHGPVATRLLGVAVDNLRNLTIGQAETLAVLLAQDDAAADVAALLVEPAAA